MQGPVHPGPVAAIAPPLASTRQQPSSRISMLPVLLAVVGAGGLTTGIYYLAVDGRQQCTTGEMPPCAYRRDTSRWGWVFLSGGAAALAGAITATIWEIRATPTLALHAGPASLHITGRF
jgi:hypothetical protein